MLSALVVAAALAAPVQDPAPAATPAQWAVRLAGEERAAARAELLALEKRAAGILAAVLDVGADEAAWQAVTLLAALGEDGTGSRADLEKLLKDEDRPAVRRALAALGLGAVGPKNAKAAKALIGVLEDRPAPEISVAARVALAQLGKAAAKPAAKLMKADNVIVRQYGAQVLYALGPEASGEKKALLAVLEDDGAYYLYGIAKPALERIGKPAFKDLSEAWSERRKILSRQMGAWLLPPVAYDDNAGLMDMLRRKQGAGMENEGIPTERIPPTAEMALPEKFHDFNGDGNGSVGEVFLVWAAHLAGELDRLVTDLRGADAPATFDAWRERVRPVERSTEGVETLDPALRKKDG